QQFHGDERLTVLLPDLMDGADVRMVQGGCRLRLALEPSQGLRVTDNLFREELQSDKTVQGQVFSLVDDTHPATAQLLDDAVVAQFKADAEILSCHSAGHWEEAPSALHEPIILGRWHNGIDKKSSQHLPSSPNPVPAALFRGGFIAVTWLGLPIWSAR